MDIFKKNDNVYGLKYIQAFVTIEVWGSTFSILIHNDFIFCDGRVFEIFLSFGLACFREEGNIM
jgi:hypothetical protein